MKQTINASTNNQKAYRLDSIDLVRGLAVVLMAIDHVRGFLIMPALPTIQWQRAR